MADNAFWVVQVSTPYKSLAKRGEFRQEFGKLSVSYDLDKRLDYLVGIKVDGIVEEFGEMPDDETITAWRDEIKERLTVQAILKDNGNV